MMHWAFDYIGQPWVAGDHDCRGFFRRGLAGGRRQFAGERANWVPVARPQEGDAVLLAHARHPSHVGLWVDADHGGVLHCVQGAGVVFQSLKSLKAMGWNHLEFYRHV